MPAADIPERAGPQRSRARTSGRVFVDRLSKAVKSIAEVVARFWPISRTPDEILDRYRRR